MNIVSHGECELSNKNIGPLIKEMSSDIAEEYLRENIDGEYSQDEVKQGLHILNKEVAQIVLKAVRNQGGV